MSDLKKLPKLVPNKEIPFKFKAIGSVSGDVYEGDFVVRAPIVRDQSDIGLELAKLNGGIPYANLDDGTAILHNGIAYLRTLLVESPDWFSDPEDGINYGMNTYDSNIVISLFQKASQEVGKWQKKLRGKAPKSEKEETKEAAKK